MPGFSRRGVGPLESTCPNTWPPNPLPRPTEAVAGPGAPIVGLVLAIYIITFITGLPTNLLALVTFVRQVRRRPNPGTVLLLNLTVSDLLLLLFLPFKMAEAGTNMTWQLPAILCPITNYCYYTCIYVSTLFLTGLGVDRYLSVAFPVQYKLRRRPAYAVAASMAFWVLACAHCSIVFIGHYYRNHGMNQRCYDDFSSDQLHVVLPFRLELSLVLFWLPATITIFCYVNFVRILLALPNIPQRRKHRAVGLAVATLANFVICFAPYNISHVVGFVEKRSPPWRIYALLLSTFNASLDPVVFYFSSNTVRKAFVTCLTSVAGRVRGAVPQWPCLGTSREGGEDTRTGSGDELEGSSG
ncbi:free fatty acid receptor 2-like [Alligator mississippiensis]|uniref:Free fatty acid receptor 2-like n=1 Tax=Alligator mississippiensis TaxID=8496 RepID=A0A151MLM7_ALLMI|nr:free fatty acid receptor 2-like [Alligator mississippiensis]